MFNEIKYILEQIKNQPAQRSVMCQVHFDVDVVADVDLQHTCFEFLQNTVKSLTT